MADESVTVEAVQPNVEAPTADGTTANNESTEPVISPESEPTEAEKTVEPVEPEEEKNESQEAEAKESAPAAGDETPKDGEKKEDSMLKTTRRNFADVRQNIKFDPTCLPDTDDASQIRGQVEFYFSDNNLAGDEYLWNLTGGPENKPVDLKKICSFKRMRRFKPYEAIVKALRDSPILQLSGDDGSELVSRKHPYDPSKPRNLMECSVYVKGFGDEQPSTQFDIEAFFAKFDAVNAIRLRRTPEGLFKGSVFAEFETPEQAQAFLALDPQPKWKSHELKIMSKKAYVDEKNELIREGKLQPSEYSRFWEGKGGRGDKNGRGGRGRGRGNWHNKNRSSDPDDWKARKADDRKNGFRGRGRGRGRGGRGGNRDRRDRDDNKRDGDDKATELTKRARDEDGATEDRPAKKVDTKVEGAE